MAVVDFTYPYMDDYASAIVKKQHAAGLRSLEDLGRQSTVKYAVVDGGSTEQHFRASRFEIYERMWVEMRRHAGFVGTLAEGVERVLASSDAEPWALIAHKTALDFYRSQRCHDLEVILGDHFTNRLALALPLSSPYYAHFNRAVVEMVESEEMNILRQRWWPECPNP